LLVLEKLHDFGVSAAVVVSVVVVVVAVVLISFLLFSFNHGFFLLNENEKLKKRTKSEGLKHVTEKSQV